MRKNSKTTLALSGGAPVRRKGFPAWPQYAREEEKQLLEVLYKTKFGIGKRVGKIQEFEEKFAAYHEARYAVACTNCTHALEVMLSVCGVGAGDEVIVPSYTFIATASAVTRVGAIPVFADIDLNTYTIDVNHVKSLITKRAKAIIPVHFAGQFADMEKIGRLAEKHKIVVIEDAAQAHGGKWSGQFAGHYGAGAGFSFQYSKNMTAGEGGILLTNSKDFYEKCWSAVWHGRKKGGIWYEHFEATSNFRITEWQAALLLAQLKKLKNQTERRMENAAFLDEKLKNVAEVRAVNGDGKMDVHPRHLYILRFLEERFKNISKDKIVKALNAEGIPALSGYAFPLYRTPAFQNNEFGIRNCQFNKKVYLKIINYKNVFHPSAEKACRESVWLLHPVLLGTKADMKHIAEAVKKVVAHRKELEE